MSKQKRQSISRKSHLLLALALLAGLVMPVLHAGKVAAAGQLSARSLTLKSGGVDGPDADTIVDGGSEPSGIANHYFQFSPGTNGNVGSILFEYCTTANPATACITPNGLSTTGAGITFDQTGSAATGFTLVNTSQPNGKPYITRTVAPVATTDVLKFTLLGITNPDNTTCYQSSTDPAARNNCTFFVRISTYASTDTSGPVTDTGTVAASTATPITLSGYMPESLVFCTGAVINETNNVPDCNTATSGNIAFPDFSPTVTSFTTSQMAASTNAGSGYAITVNGATMTSGSNTVTAVSGAGGDTCKPGTSQFALNLVQNTNFCGNTGQTVGAGITSPTGGSTYKGEAISPYNTNGTYRFDNTALNSIADSALGGAGGTDAQVYTVSYIVNVPGSQPAGTYTTTLTYICTPTF